MIIGCYVLGVTGLLTSIITVFCFFISTILLMTCKCCQFLKTVPNLPQIENEHFTPCEKQ